MHACARTKSIYLKHCIGLISLCLLGGETATGTAFKPCYCVTSTDSKLGLCQRSC